MKARLMTIALAVLAVPTAGFGQVDKTPIRLQKTDFLVSAEAGWVNVVEGDVAFKRGSADWDMVITGDELQTGDVVRTGSDGRAELLLNPGSYLRLSNASEAVFTNTSLDDLAINLVRGSAIVEVSSVGGWEGAFLTMKTPKGKFSIVRGGVYRFNVDETGRSEILVRKGRLVIEGDAPVTVKDGKRIVLNGDSPLIASFDKKAEDEFDLWSRTRAEILVAANRKLSRRALSRAALGFNSGSLWLFDPFRRCYTFLPGFWGYRSPYGGSYSSCNPHFNPWGGRSNTAYSSGTSTSPRYGGGGWSSSPGSGTISRPGPSPTAAPRSSGTVNSGGWTSGGSGTINRPASRPSSRP